METVLEDREGTSQTESQSFECINSAETVLFPRTVYEAKYIYIKKRLAVCI